MKDIILASASPRRKELLASIHLPFKVITADVEEIFEDDLPIGEAIQKVALTKAKAVAQLHNDALVIGADTVVMMDGKRLGKPKDDKEAYAMLQSLSGKTHQVITGVAICEGDKVETFYEVSEVVMYPLSDEDILSYIAKDQPFDKAGAYGIQTYGKILVKAIHGDYFNIVGLPIARLYRELKKYE